MSWLEFVSTLIGHILGWPVVLVVLVLVLRDPIKKLATREGLESIKAGPGGIEAKWVTERIQDAKHDLETAQPPALRSGYADKETQAVADDFVEEMRQLSEIQPRAVVLESHSRLEQLFRDLVPSLDIHEGRFPSMRSLARRPTELELLSDGEVEALSELTKLRNVVAHDPRLQLTAEQAMNYVGVARQIALALRIASGQTYTESPPL